jgi:predicted dehydrogenase
MSDTRAALRLDGVDAAIVCTPATAHCGVAREALLAGKHVLVEKPITTQAADCCDLNDLADSRGLVLMVGHTFLFNPAVRKVKEYMQRGDAGRFIIHTHTSNMGFVR